MARRRYQAQSFDARTIPEIASGYFWRASLTSGFGTSAFRVIEGNGHSTFDLVQATVANQPTLLTENGGTQFRMRRSVDANPTTMQTSAGVAAGWTGATYIAGWFRLPDASGDITNFATLLNHSASPRRIKLQAIVQGGIDRVLISVSSLDGSGGFACVKGVDNTGIFAGGNWAWVEGIFDPLLVLGGSVDADRLKIFSGFSLLPFTQTSGSPLAAIADSSVALSVANQGTGAPNTDTTDWAACYYGNGIPSLANRKRLANLDNPTGVAFA